MVPFRTHTTVSPSSISGSDTLKSSSNPTPEITSRSPLATPPAGLALSLTPTFPATQPYPPPRAPHNREPLMQGWPLHARCTPAKWTGTLLRTLSQQVYPTPASAREHSKSVSSMYSAVRVCDVCKSLSSMYSAVCVCDVCKSRSSMSVSCHDSFTHSMSQALRHAGVDSGRHVYDEILLNLRSRCQCCLFG